MLGDFDTDGWRARITPDIVSDCDKVELVQVLVVDSDRLAIFPTEWSSDGKPVMYQQDAAGALVEPTPLWLPRGAVAAIQQAGEPSGGAARAEIRRLEEALAVERARVDRLLGLVGGARL